MIFSNQNLPRMKSNKNGRIANITDLPYPVSKATKVSFSEAKPSILSSCLGFNCFKPILFAASERACENSSPDEQSISRYKIQAHVQICDEIECQIPASAYANSMNELIVTNKVSRTF